MVGTVKEADLQAAVVDVARRLGYMVAHFRPARTTQGWRTPVSGDGAGFPDLVLVGNDRILFVELKSQRGRLTADQERWRDQLVAAGGEWHLWKPSDWPVRVMEALR